MKSFSTIICEVVKNNITSKDLLDYLGKFKKNLPLPIQRIISISQEYGITKEEDLDKFKSAHPKDLSKLSNQFGIPEKTAEVLHNLFKDAGNTLPLLPQKMSDGVFQAMMRGSLGVDDILLDVKSARGKNQAAKQYMPVVYKVVNQYVGKSNLSRSDLISAALVGLNKAIEEWSPEPNKEGKVVSFKTMVGFRVKQEILAEISNNSHTVSGGSYYLTKKYGSTMLDAISIDNYNGEEIDQSRLAALGMDDEPDPDAKKDWESLYKLMEKTFPERTCNVFYRFFGINGFKKEKSKDIAKSLGLSEGAIQNNFIKKVLKWMRENKQAQNILADIQDMYTESLMCQLYGCDKDIILESLLSDDIYILLEEMNPWKSKESFVKAHDMAYKQLSKKEQEVIQKLLGGNFLTLDNNLKKENPTIKKYLMLMYPKLNVNQLSDVSILDYMSELQNIFKK